MKIWLNDANEAWIVDKLKKEFVSENKNIVATNTNDVSHVWLIADWAYSQIPYEFLKSRKVLTSVHHITTWKFDNERNAREDFSRRDAITHKYHVPCEKTAQQVRRLSDKPVEVQPFWVNSSEFYPLVGLSKEKLRQSLGLPTDAFIVFSAQRDTEGASIGDGKIPQPKREKGPDSLVSNLVHLREKHPNLFVALAGWRRHYVMMRLDELKIPYKMFELPSVHVINELYNAVDLYVCASRIEGGPQAIVECAAAFCPIISTDVGLASTILAPESVGKIDPENATEEEISNDLSSLVPNVEQAYLNVEKYFIPRGMLWFEKLLNEL